MGNECLPGEYGHKDGRTDDFSGIELSPEQLAELLDPESWGVVLEEYARTVGLAVALTDVEGHLIGTCQNPRPVWSMVRDARPEWRPECPFCLPPSRCTAIADALRTAHVVLAHDDAGAAHIAVPLSLGDRRLGALIAGQVFDRYPESLQLQRVAREVGISAQELFRLATQQAPMNRATLHVYGDLLCTLGHAFLRQRYGAIVERKLVETDRRFRLLVEAAKDYAFFTVDAAGRITSWNSGAECLLGYTEAEIIGQQFSRVFTPDDVQAGMPEKKLRTAAREGQAADERWCVRKDGSRVFVTGILTSIGEGDSGEFGNIIHDITERKRAEDLLRGMNEDLTQFAHAASHDLQEPLRIVMSYTQLLARLYKGKLDEQADKFMAYVVDGAKRMERLLKDLRDYLSVNAEGLEQRVPINCNRTLEKALEFLDMVIRDSGGVVTHDPLPTVMAGDLPLVLLFQNLVGNALKYHREGERPRIHVSAERKFSGQHSENMWVFSVRDNGIGVEAEHLEGIFAPFKRLHGAEYPGSGIGLAICQKIVGRYGGRIWVESEYGQGSTFRFTIPASSEAD